MSIERDFYVERSDGIKLFRTHSSNGVKIRKIGTDEVYDDAVDVETSPWTYEETDEKIDTEEFVENQEPEVE